jgi:RNA polymerase sigma factor (sigma-70 family)
MFSSSHDAHVDESPETSWQAEPVGSHASPAPRQPGHGDVEATSEAGEARQANSGFNAYLRVVRNRPRLNAEQERALFAQVSHGTPAACHRAQTTLVQSHLWLVPVVVRRFHRQGGFEDLVAEGNLGLFKALARFDPTRGLRFSSYAKWWVMHAVTAAMAANAHPVCMPSRIAQRLSKAQHSGGMAFLPRRSEPAQAPLRPPASGSSGGPFYVPDVPELSDLPGHASAHDPQRHLARADDPRANDPSAADSSADDARHQPDALLTQKQDTVRLAQALAGLSARERSVLQARYGLTGGEPRTLQDTARELSLSAEGVRKIQMAAMAKLRLTLAQ